MTLHFLGMIQVAKEMNLGRTAVGRWTDQHKAELLGQSGIGKPLTSESQKSSTQPTSGTWPVLNPTPPSSV